MYRVQSRLQHCGSAHITHAESQTIFGKFGKCSTTWNHLQVPSVCGNISQTGGVAGKFCRSIRLERAIFFSHFRLKMISPLHFLLFQKHMNTHQQPSDNPPASNSRTKTSSYPTIHSEYSPNYHFTFSDVM